MERGLIFDCDGVLADTELHGHLVAFNQMWKKLGAPWRWSPEQYAEKLKIGGGKERMASLFLDKDFQQVLAVPENEEERTALITNLHTGGTNRALVRADAPVADRVGIVTGGGSGHLPVFLGYVGRGLASGVAVGNVFSSPTVDHIVATTRGVHSGKGVLYLYGNYSGDVLNFDTAAEIVDADGIQVETVLLADDVASAPPERSANRRGVAGLFFAYK